MAPIVYYITKNAPDGTSSFLDVPTPPSQPIGPGATLTYLYSAPPNFSIAQNTDLAYHQAAPTEPPLRSFPPAGAVGTVVLDFGPNPTREAGLMHRSLTLDYAVMLEGELELTLDGGETKLVKRGDVVVQRRAMHAWKNLSATEGARLFAVSIGDEGAEEGVMEFPEAKGQ